ncbi:MAG: Hpt domain-containing protein [Vicinamibacteria bacterium]|nr:Hpt domain-containing protein [Vicinamibacteria bacterium]
MTDDLAAIPLFDPVAIEKLRAVAGDQGATFVAEMAQLFLHESANALEDLKEYRDQGDWKQVTRIAHSLKSSSATLGLMRLSAACRSLEIDTKGGAASPDTPRRVASLLDEFTRATPTIEGLS